MTYPLLTPLEALRRLIAEVKQLDVAEVGERWNQLQGELDVAEGVVRDFKAEPVAWGILNDTCPELTNDQGLGEYWARKGRKVTPLYAAPSSAGSAAKYPPVQLTRRHTGECEVLLEIDGKWVSVIQDNGDIIGHIVEPLGVEIAVAKSKHNEAWFAAITQGEKQ